MRIVVLPGSEKKGRVDVLNLSLAELAFLILFVVTVILVWYWHSTENVRNQNQELIAKLDSLVNKVEYYESKRSNIPPPCRPPIADAVAVSSSEVRFEGVIMKIDEFLDSIEDRIIWAEKDGNRRAKINLYPSPSLTSTDFNQCAMRLRRTLYYVHPVSFGVEP